jgi:hypothetical protein
MHLVYFDESGNSGTNLRDPQQPFFVLAALTVPETEWVGLEHEGGAPLKPIDKGGVEGISPFIYRGDEALRDVIAWMAEQEKKGAARENSPGSA